MPGNPADRVAHFRSVHDLPVAPGRLERTIARSPVLSSEDGAIRWKEGERLHHLLEQACRRFGANDAVVTDQAVITYRDLDKRANQVARYLIDRGIEPGDRVGLLFDKSVETYVALLAVMKVNAAYVPLDPGFPTERIGFILADASIKTVVSMADFARELGAFNVAAPSRYRERRPSMRSRTRPSPRTRSRRRSMSLLHHLYLGTTGKPKGVAIEHPSICNFVRVAAERYGFAPGDRATRA